MSAAVRLHNGVSMPLIGFGTYRIRGRDIIHKCLNAALKNGYCSIDTAAIYKNEEDIGLALEDLCPKHNIERHQLFITSKLSPTEQGYDGCIRSVERSLQLLKTTYLDLYLIHWPGSGGLKVDDLENIARRRESWKALEYCHQQGLIRAIGVSNYCISHLEEMKSYSEIIPHVLQVEHHPHYNQKDLVKYCQQHDIHYQAYSSLGTTIDAVSNPLLNDPTVCQLAWQYHRTPAQLLLRWATQQGIGVLPKSTNDVHIAENIQLDFNLDKADLNALNNLGITHKYAWDPNVVV